MAKKFRSADWFGRDDKMGFVATIALVNDGDLIEPDVEQRKLHLDISDEELLKRRAKWVQSKP